MSRLTIFSIIIGFSFLSCKRKSDNDPIPVPQMKFVMWDMMKADEWYLTATLKDSTFVKRKENLKMYQKIFLIHGITKDKFYKSYHYYEAHPIEMRILVDSLDQFSQRERTRVFENHGQAPK